ncbi:MAG: DUF3443 family protein [Terriglobales bacterium]
MRKFYCSVLVTAILGFAAGCGSGSGSTPVGVPPSGSNILSIAVDGGPVSGVNYQDAAFASAKICAPSTSTCVTVDHLLVDTGSVGIRVLASALGTLSLPVTTDGSGNNLNDCVQFVDTSYLWGQVESADVTLSGEVASNIPIHVLADPTGFAIPSTCNTGGPDEDTLASLGTNGILGVAPEPVDCLSCDQSISGLSVPPTGVYYLCSSSSCQSAFVPEANQVVNPVVTFPLDNNGVIVELPAPTSANAASLTGSLIFGIGTQSNNALGSATAFALDTSDNFTTVFPATNGQTLTASFIDSGSNGLFFPDSATDVPVVQCSDTGVAPSYYCPASTQALSAQNLGANGASGTVSFNVDNAENLFNNDSSDAVMQNLAGSNGIGTCAAGSGQCSFDWGLPFFYGRNVYTAIDGQAVPSTAPPAPWWAY